jgi:hypothetical protein
MESWQRRQSRQNAAALIRAALTVIPAYLIAQALLDVLLGEIISLRA